MLDRRLDEPKIFSPKMDVLWGKCACMDGQRAVPFPSHLSIIRNIPGLGGDEESGLCKTSYCPGI